MLYRNLLVVCALCVVCCLAFAMLPGEAYSQNDSEEAKSSDKDVAKRQGVSESLAPVTGGKKGDGPTKAQMALGIGSCVAVWIVMKWL